MNEEIKFVKDNNFWNLDPLLEVQSPLVINGYLKPKDNQRVISRDIKIIFLIKDLIKTKALIMKRLLLYFQQKALLE